MFAGGCSHNKAYLYYVESIGNPNAAFMSTFCTSYGDFENGNCGESPIQVPMGEGLQPFM